MKVAVITPYHKSRRDWLEKCHHSVLLQTHPCTHILVADGFPEDYVNQWKARHIILKKGHNDFGDTPRAIGSMYAIGQGFDAIAYLDDDNWYHPQHIESLLQVHQETKSSICFAHRLMVGVDGNPLGECPFTYLDNFSDTSCYLITKPAFEMATYWSLIPLEYHVLGDRLMLLKIQQEKISRAFSNLMTVAYRTKFPQDYQRFKQPIPPSAYKVETLNKIGLACQKFQQQTGVNLSIKQLRHPRPYDGKFWDGNIPILQSIRLHGQSELKIEN